MFERFTGEARLAVVAAQEECRRLRARQVGSEHLLIAVAAAGGSAAQALAAGGATADDLRLAAAPGPDPAALAALGIDLEEVRRRAGLLPGRAPGPEPTGHLPFDAQAKKALELSLRESLALGHRSITAGHLLLGLLRDEDSRAVALLRAAGLDLAALRASVVAQLPAEPRRRGGLFSRLRRTAA